MNKFNETDAVFLKRLISLLNGEVKAKSKESADAEEFFDTLKWQLTHCFEDALKINAMPSDFKLAPFIAEHVNDPIERIKEQIEKPWLKDRFTIGLLGHFSVGKTTALNSILSENFPVNDNENTALAAYLIKGTNGEMSIVTKSGQALVLKEDDSKALDYEEGQRRFPFARIFDYIVKENSSQLLDKITIIDTPGLGKNFTHSEPTIRALNSCDAAIWFVKLGNAVETSDTNFIKENIGGKPLFVVFSFVDDCENPEKAIKAAKDTFSKAKIDVQGYFHLGDSSLLKDEFRNKIVIALTEAAEKHDTYNPYVHIYSVICFLEEIILKYKQSVTEKYNKLDRDTDKLVEAYQRSRQTFVTEFNTCSRIMSDVIDTFNNRCSGATFCGGASSAICNLLNSYNESFHKMSEADDAIDVKKLIEFGQGTSEMNFYDYRSKQAAEILETISSLKKIFE